MKARVPKMRPRVLVTLSVTFVMLLAKVVTLVRMSVMQTCGFKKLLAGINM